MASATNGIKVDYINHQIVLNRGFAKKVKNINSQEYDILKRVIAENPTCTVFVKECNAPAKVERYEGLNLAFIYDYIKKYDNNPEERLEEFEQQRWIAKCHGDKFGILRKWFLNTYPECIIKSDKESKNTEETEEQKSNDETLTKAA